MQVFVAAFVILGLVVVLSSIGYLVKKKPLAGSCGGKWNQNDEKGDCIVCGAKEDGKCGKKTGSA